MIGRALGRTALLLAMMGVSATTVPGGSFAAATKDPNETGKGWGSMLACSACLLGAGMVIAGGPASIIVAVNTPGSAVAALACVSSCYDAFQ